EKTDVQPRLEIHDLIKEEKQFTLFCLGWNAIRNPKFEPAAARYNEQAGIHGMPYAPWIGDPDGDAKKPADDRVPFKGKSSYCNHASVLFPTWHRPSLMMLEQSIWQEGAKIAAEFAAKHPTEAKDWLDASHKLRFPYWDWTNPRETKKFPQIFREPKVKLHVPEGKTEEHPNPVHTYELPQPLPDGFEDRQVENPVLFPRTTPKDKWPWAYYGQWERTYRWPSSQPVNPTENINILDFILDGGKLYPDAPAASWTDLKNKVNALFLYPPITEMPQGSEAYAWDKFSNTRAMSHPTREEWKHPGTGPYWDIATKLKDLTSVESSHNLLHLLVGGLGHMMDNDYASFDPIFFLHHCNVDRIFALWENAYPNYYMGHDGYNDKDGVQRQFRQVDGKWGWPDQPGSNPPESAIDLKGDTPLTPFRKADGSYWTSDDTRWGSKMPKNYTYKDVHLKQDAVDPLMSSTAVTLRCSLAEPHAESRPARNEAELQENRATLQRLFGFNPVPVRQRAYQTLAALEAHKRLTYPPIKEQHTKGYELIHDYRHYVVCVRLDPYAIGISYSVNIRYNTLNVLSKEVIRGHIGSAASLVRSESTKCGACKARSEAGAKAVYHITIPHDVIARMASHSGEFDTLRLITESLSADITLPDGYVVANTPADTSANQALIPEKLVPEITVLSAAL
ncbi:hypothetical protein FRC11_010784, partial [Ceratobasidium sp. 423]